MKPWIIMGNSRIGRLRCIAYSVWLLVALLPILTLEFVFMSKEMTTGYVLADLVMTVVSVPINLMFSIRRLHDMDRSGWWSLIQIPMSFVSPKVLYMSHGSGAIAVVADIALLVIVIYALALIFVPGSKGDNHFGSPPPPNSGWVIAGVITGICLPFAGCMAAAILFAAHR